MGFSRRWLRWRTVRNDDGYEVGFVGMKGRVRLLRYREAGKSLTIGAEPVKLDTMNGWGIHISLGQQYLSKWDDGVPLTAQQQEAIRKRVPAALEYMRVIYTVDRE